MSELSKQLREQVGWDSGTWAAPLLAAAREIEQLEMALKLRTEYAVPFIHLADRVVSLHERMQDLTHYDADDQFEAIVREASFMLQDKRAQDALSIPSPKGDSQGESRANMKPAICANCGQEGDHHVQDGENSGWLCEGVPGKSLLGVFPNIREWFRGSPSCIVINFAGDLTNEQIDALPKLLMRAVHSQGNSA